LGDYDDLDRVGVGKSRIRGRVRWCSDLGAIGEMRNGMHTGTSAISGWPAGSVACCIVVDSGILSDQEGRINGHHCGAYLAVKAESLCRTWYRPPVSVAASQRKQ